MKIGKLNRKKLYFKPLSQRLSKSKIEDILIEPNSKPPPIPVGYETKLEDLACSIKLSRENNAPIVWAFGAHLVKNGLSKILNKLIEDGYVQHILANEAVIIHDWELAYHGRTEEDVRENIAKGEFGLWEETGRYINMAIKFGARNNLGYGESVGKLICDEELEEGEGEIIHKYKQHSILSEAYRLKIPFSVGATIGQNIHHTHPECDYGAIGKSSGIDFLKLANTLSNIHNGGYISIGSAILSPQIFEKALSMARNIAIQEHKSIDGFFMAINDIQPGQWDWSKGEPPKDNPAYYLRFMKTFARIDSNSVYYQIDNRTFLHNLYHLLK